MLTIRRSARMSAGCCARTARRSRRVGAGMEFADHRDYVAGRRSALPRLEPVRPAGASGAAALRGGRGPARSTCWSTPAPRWRWAAAQARSGAADRRRARLRRPRQPRSRRGDGRSATTRRRRCRPARGKGAILPILRFLDGVQRDGRTVGAGGGGARVPVAAAAAAGAGWWSLISDFYDPAGHRAALDLLRHHRLEVVADPGERARRAGARRCAATSSCATSRPASCATLTVSPRSLADVRAAPRRRCCATSRATAASAPSPASRSCSDQAVRRGRAADVPRGRPARAEERARHGAARPRSLSMARCRRAPTRAVVAASPAPRRSPRSTCCGCAGAAWSCRSRRCGWTPPGAAPHRPLGAAAARLAVAAAGAGAAGRCCWSRRVDPRARGRPTARGRSVVVLIDRSASMSARDGAGTRLDAARARADAIVDGLAAADRALVASFAADAVAESGFEADAGRLRRAIAARRAQRGAGRSAARADVRAGVLRGRPRPTVVLVSDGALQRRGAPDDAGRRRRPLRGVGYVPVGRRGRQRRHHLVRGAAAARRSGRGRGRAGRAELRRRRQRRRGRHRRRATRPSSASRLTLAPGERRRQSSPTCSRADARLQARLLTAAGRSPAPTTIWRSTTPRTRSFRPSRAAACCASAARTSTSTARSSASGAPCTVDRLAPAGGRGAARALGRLRPRHLRRRHARGAAQKPGASSIWTRTARAARSPRARHACAIR